MSENTSQTNNTLTAHDVEKIAVLSRLAIDQSKASEYAESINKLLGMIEALQGIDTTGVEPLRSPFDHAQPLREDVVTEPDRRADYQAVAPVVQDGLYLVPRVIE